MNKLQEKLVGVRTFFQDVGGEMRKCTWPERQELLESTVVVILSLVLLSAFVGVCDKVLMTVLQWLFRLV